MTRRWFEKHESVYGGASCWDICCYEDRGFPRPNQVDQMPTGRRLRNRLAVRLVFEFVQTHTRPGDAHPWDVLRGLFPHDHALIDEVMADVAFKNLEGKP